MAPTEEDQFDFLFKVVLIGDCGVGKTCVVTRFKSGNFIERHASTIGVDFSMKTIMVDGKKVKVSYSGLFACILSGLASFELVNSCYITKLELLLSLYLPTGWQLLGIFWETFMLVLSYININLVISC